ncbi:MAG: DUF5715 family protein [Paludibacter sp.]
MYHYRRKKTAIYKKISIWITIIILIITINFAFHFHKNTITLAVTKKETKIYTPDCNHVLFPSAPIIPSSKLNDPNEVQLIHALKNGLKKPFATDQALFSSLDSLKRKSILFEVTENNFYQFKSLTHSQPYLIPEAIDLLNEIGYRFQKKLEEKKKNIYRYQITSLLRTEEEQTRLHHRNRNAASHSTHMYGTTIDISYKNFFNMKSRIVEPNYDAVQAMTKVLIEMRQECRLLCVREHHQSCFHITVVVCRH